MSVYPYLTPNCNYPEYADITIKQAKKLFSGQGDRVGQAVAAQWKVIAVE